MLGCLLPLLLRIRDHGFESVSRDQLKLLTFFVVFYVAQTLLLKTDHSNFLPTIHLPFTNNHSIILLLVMYVVHTADYDVLMTMKIINKNNNNNRCSNNNMTIIARKIRSMKQGQYVPTHGDDTHI